MKTGRQSGSGTRLLLVALNHAPELTGIGKYVGEMTAYLVQAGFKVKVIAAPPYYPAWSVQPPYVAWRYQREERDGAIVWRCPLYVGNRPGGLWRIVHLLSFALSSLPVILLQGLFWRPQVVMVIEPPLVCAPAACLAAGLAGGQAWLHVQDFEVDAAFDLGLLKSPRARAIASAFERWLMQRFDVVSSISARMVERLQRKGVAASRSRYFTNWVDTSLIQPMDRDNALRAELAIPAATRVALYSGNMGEKQGLDLLADVARAFAPDEQVLFLFCGDGVSRARLQEATAGMPHVRFLPLQPLDRLNELLCLADVHLLPQRAGAEDLVMPSKLTAILASGRPVVATATAGTELARAAGAGGRVVPAGDAQAFIAALRELLADAALCQKLGASGREFAQANFDREAVLGRLAQDLRRLSAKN